MIGSSDGLAAILSANHILSSNQFRILFWLMESPKGDCFQVDKEVLRRKCRLTPDVLDQELDGLKFGGASKYNIHLIYADQGIVTWVLSK